MKRALTVLVVAAGAAAASGCAMTVDTFTLSDFNDRNYGLRIEQRTKREVAMAFESYNDDRELWAISTDSRVLCLANASQSSGAIRQSWTIYPNTQTLIYRQRPQQGGQFRVRPQASNPNCSVW